ncbi:Deoxyribodipyrimidine photolyase [Operophtera brumata]|uniref:Deoxyribodipyrimidine photolyase n=1 Tax=Operophtera brumata TaxID=104452 RepID=A0A0L7LNJ5_OPEBR|nr:Deoxyribodipyrimidine photolyase [Operophtera brumata]
MALSWTSNDKYGVLLYSTNIYCFRKLIDKKMGAAKRLKNQRRVNTHPEDDSASIAHNMEEPGLSIPPAEALRSIP